MRTLIAYASKHGATGGIAERIGQTLRARGIDADVKPAGDITDISGYEAVILGSAVYFGSWMKVAAELARRNREALAARPVWLFSSGPIGATPLPEPKEIAELRAALRPRDHREFAGALDASALAFTERVIVKVMKATSGDFRDWSDIDAWAESIASALSPSGAPASRAQ